MRLISRFRENRFGSLQHFRDLRYNASRGKEVTKMDTRRKIDAMLDKITSQQQLKRIYNFVKYVYIYSTK